MPLKLGNVVSDEFSAMSMEELLVEAIDTSWLEEDQHFVDLVNAFEIVTKAKSTQSTECLAFAEDLLGCSCEELYCSMEKEMFRTALRSASVFYNRAKTLSTIYGTMYKKFEWSGSLHPSSTKVRIPGLIVQVSNKSTNDISTLRYAADKSTEKKKTSYSKPGIDYSENDVTMELSEAISTYKKALDAIAIVLKPYVRYAQDDKRESAAVAGRVRYALTKGSRDTDKYIDMYNDCREIVKAVLAYAGSFVKQAQHLTNRRTSIGTAEKHVNAKNLDKHFLRR